MPYGPVRIATPIRRTGPYEETVRFNPQLHYSRHFDFRGPYIHYMLNTYILTNIIKVA